MGWSAFLDLGQMLSIFQDQVHIYECFISEENHKIEWFCSHKKGNIKHSVQSNHVLSTHRAFFPLLVKQKFHLGGAFPGSWSSGESHEFNYHLNLGHLIEQTGGAYPFWMYANSFIYHRYENEFSDWLVPFHSKQVVANCSNCRFSALNVNRVYTENQFKRTLRVLKSVLMWKKKKKNNQASIGHL